VLIVQLLVTVAVTLRFAVAVAAVAFVEPNPANAIPAAAMIPANLIDRFTSRLLLRLYRFEPRSLEWPD
jgi:hypothetical protein